MTTDTVMAASILLGEEVQSWVAWVTDLQTCALDQRESYSRAFGARKKAEAGSPTTHRAPLA